MVIGVIFDEQVAEHSIMAGDFNFDVNACSKGYRKCAARFTVTLCWIFLFLFYHICICAAIWRNKR